MKAHARKADPITSHKAAARVKIGPQQMAVLEALSRRNGATAKQLGWYMGSGGNFYTYEWPRKRMKELVKLGYVTREVYKGESEQRCYITDKGREVLL